MSANHPNILYIGNELRRENFAEQVINHDWHVFMPFEVEEALAQYVFFLPDMVIFDTTTDENFTPADFDEVYMHLHSIAVEPIIIVSDDAWDTTELPFSVLLPSTATIEEITEAIETLIYVRTGQQVHRSTPQLER